MHKAFLAATVRLDNLLDGSLHEVSVQNDVPDTNHLQEQF